jgi:hypothetical protein
MIPRGTFASEDDLPVLAGASAALALPEKAPGDRREPAVRSGVRPRQELGPSLEAAPVPVAPREKRADEKPRAPEKPPFLASEIMREELCPRTPARNLLTLSLRSCAALGLVVGWLGLSSPAGAFIAVGALGLLGISFLSLTYAARAAAALAVSGVAFVMMLSWRLSIVQRPDDVLLAVTVISLSSALWLRAWHRGSNLSRYLVAGGLTGAGLWTTLAGNQGLLSLNWAMGSWLPAVTWVLFVILALLSLLAFMDKRTTGACDLWAVALLGWYGLYALSREALFNPGRLDTLTSLGLGEPVFAAPVSLALAQLLATLLSKQQRAHPPPIPKPAA